MIYKVKCEPVGARMLLQLLLAILASHALAQGWMPRIGRSAEPL